MKVHPKQQKTLKTARLHAKKLVHKSINVALKLIGLIGLYFYSLLVPFYGTGTSIFKKTTNDDSQEPKHHYSSNHPNHPGTEPSKRNGSKRRRRWKAGKPQSWDMTKMLSKMIILTIIALHNIEDLHKTDLNKKLYNLVHNTRFVKQRGNAFPIKPDTMMKNRRRIYSMNRSKYREREKNTRI